MASTPFSQRFLNRLVKPLQVMWGRLANRSGWDDRPPSSNPDDTPEEVWFDISNNPYVVAGRIFRDVSKLFVTASGMEEEDTGAFFPAQLIYTTPDIGDEEILNFLAWQYDEGFEGMSWFKAQAGFAQII